MGVPPPSLNSFLIFNDIATAGAGYPLQVRTSLRCVCELFHIAVVVFPLLGGAGVGLAQNPKTDSLLSLLKTDAADTNKQLGDMKTKFEVEKKEAELKIKAEAEQEK